MWMTKEKKGILTTDEKLKLIEEFKKLNPEGTVVLNGGETMLKYDEFFALTNKCLSLGLLCAANTNASLINDQNIRRILAEGPRYLVISLDSNIENIHDYSRGKSGSCKQVISIIEKLVSQKRNGNYKTEIITNSVIFDQNIHHLTEFIKFAEKIGLDGCLFQMLSRTFYNNGKTDQFFDNHFFKDKQNALQQVQTIIDTLNEHPIIRTTKQDFEWMKEYVKNPDFIGEQVCGSHEKNMMIDSYGEIQLCFNMKTINKGKSLGNIRDYESIGDVWSSCEASKIRKIMENCRLNCGMLNCHRKD